MSDELAGLEVVFAANIDQVTAASSAIDSVFASVASAAESSGSDITSSMSAAAESLSSISSAASHIATGVEEGVSGATEALSSLPAVGEEAGSSLADSMSSSLSGFSSLQDAVSALADSVNTAVSEIDTQIQSIGTTADDAASQAQSAGNGFSLGGMVNQVGMGIFSLQAMGNTATQLAGTLLGPAMAAENTQASFSNLLGGTKAASDELDKLNQFAAKTQFKTQDIDNAASSMIAFKIPTQTIIPDLTAVGDALTAVGKGTPAEMQSVVDILGKMSVQGKLTQGDITQLGAHGINALDAIAAGSGKTTAQIQAMVKNGTLPANEAIADLTKGIEKNPVYSGGMAKQSNTLSGLLSTLSSDFDQVMAAALKPALPDLEKGLAQLTNVLTSPSFKAFAVTLGTDIVDGLVTVVTDVGKLIDTGKGLVDFFSQNQLAMNLLESVLGGIAIGVAVFAAVQIPALVIGFGAWAIGAGAAALATLAAAAPFIIVGLIVGAAIFGIIEAVQHWGAITSAVGSAVKAVIGGVGSFFGGVGHDIEGIFGGIGQAANNVGAGIESAFKGGVNGVIMGLNWLINAVDSFHVNVPALVVAGVTVFGGADLGLPTIPTIPLLARGGTIAPGGYGIAGEAGAELIYGGTSGASVLGASQTAAMMNGGGGGGDTVVHIYLDGQEMTDRVMTRVVKQLRGQGGKMRSL
ncbi:hypothetical protein ccbrp13_56340 [Ktedonobacteria bacterium brp13]|nr:hypothetical protein ccbrp13_56340 [Ktedonobacteria bacterium brp13]